MKNLLFVMNPYAGMRKANRYLADILALFNRAGYTVVTHMTAGPGDATDAVARLASAMDLVVCCGGDGTLNETINGLLACGQNIPIGYIPAGSTNDFATSLHLPAEPLKAAEAILEGVPTASDVGDFGGRRFSYVASFGAFTKSSYSTPQNVKNALGHTAYVLSGIQEISQLRTTHMRLEVDDEVIEDDFLYGMVCNTYSVAGMMALSANRVVMDDGLFEVVLVRKSVKIPDLLSALLSLANDRPLETDSVLSFEASSLTIISEKPIPWTVDGEYGGTYSVSQVNNLRQALTVIQGK